MKNNTLKYLAVFLTIMCSTMIHSQNISGTVSDVSGPLPGASVLVKGTTNGAQTNFDGSYSLKNVGTNATLVFSYMGFKSQEISVSGKSTINVQLEEESNKLSEVVVIGYGTVKKKDATGAVDQIGTKDFDNISATSPADLLRGKVSGVQVISSSGEPGAAASIRIRGNSSIRSGNGPLIVVDGVPLDGGDISSGGDNLLGTSTARNPLNFVNQNDIETMTILKDASSTAIYGSRGANGVIVITTKKGKSSEPQFTYTSSVAFSEFSSDLEIMDANAFVKNGGADNGSRSYDWKDAVLRSGITINNDVSFSKSSENSNTRLSFGSSTTDGIVKNTGLDKYTLALNNSNDFLGGFLKVDAKVNYAGIKDDAALISNNAGFIGNLIGTALYWNPTNAIRKPNGSYNVINDTYINPVQLLDSYKDFTNTNKILASIKTTLKFNNNLNYQFLFGVESSTSIRKSQLLPSIQIQNVAQAAIPNTSPEQKKYGQAAIFNNTKFARTFEHTLNYNKTFNDNFILDGLLGFSYYSYDADGSTTTARGFDDAQVNLIDNIEGGLEREYRATSFRNKSELQSYFGRINATLYKKLILTGTLRADGASKLGVNNKYDYFPSLGIAYKIIEGKSGLLNSIKLRGNYGITGNQEFATNSAIARSSYALNGELRPDSNANVNLKWETVTSYGGGLDFALLDSKLTGSVDYFNRDTQDLIFPVPAAASQPGPPTQRFINLPGNLINNGIEVAVNYKIASTENFNWDVSANASFLSNQMKNFGSNFVQAGGLNGQGLSGAYAQLVINNEPIYSYFIYEWKGYDANGNSIYTDDNGANSELGFATKKLIGKQALPKMNLGFTTNLAYKNLDAAVSFYGAFGHYLYNNTANAYFFKGAFLGGRNVPEDAATSSQAQSDPNAPSTKYLEKGDFLRMGNLTFGYTLKNSMLERARIKSARFFINGQNLLLFTKYSGFDPEVDTDKSLNGVPSAGIDYLSYPRAKTVSFGLNLTL